MASITRDLALVRQKISTITGPLAVRFKFKLWVFSFEFTLLSGYNEPSYSMEVIDVPNIAFESADTLKSIKAPSKGYAERSELRIALESLTAEQIIRLTPDDGESMRKLKRMVTEAGKDIDRSVKHIEDNGDLLVFIPAPKVEGASKRGRPPKKSEENGTE